MAKKYAMTIAGDAVGADQYAEVLNPSTGELVGFAPQASEAQLEQAVTTSAQAFASWRRADDATRSGACSAMAGVLT